LPLAIRSNVGLPLTMPIPWRYVPLKNVRFRTPPAL